MKKLRLVRGSEVGSFLTDRGAWKFRWIDRLVKNVPDKKLFFGDLFHKHMEHVVTSDNLMEAHDKTEIWLKEKDTSDMEMADYNEVVNLFHDVADYYEKTYYMRDSVDIDPIAAELRFAIPLYDDASSVRMDFAYEGTIDLLYIEEGLLKFKDYKTVSSIERYVNNSVLDRQISRYWWALTALCNGHGYIWEDFADREGGMWVHVTKHPLYGVLKKFPDGPQEFIYDIVKKEAPKPPRILKGGALSKDKSQKTTYEMFVKAIDDMGLSTSDYAEILDHLMNKGDQFLRRVPVRRNWKECESAMMDFARAAQEMLQVRSEVESGCLDRIYYNITWDTPTYNAYYPLLQAEIKGENVSLVKAALYRTEEYDPETDYIEVED
ncbi:PD-(D/E)XK nuclease superfamily protein [compost metagenome]